jgi:hypothetical protein
LAMNAGDALALLCLQAAARQHIDAWSMARPQRSSAKRSRRCSRRSRVRRWSLAGGGTLATELGVCRYLHMVT